MSFDRLLPHIKGNVGFVFTKEDLAEIRDMLLANKVRVEKSDSGVKMSGTDVTFNVVQLVVHP